MDLNMMMREQARQGLQVQLDTAVTNGDKETAAKIAKDMEALAVQLAPKVTGFGPDEIKAEMSKLDWFGVDPKKSGRAIALGRDMDPKKFASAEAFCAALVKVVDEEFKPTEDAGNDEDDGEGVETEGEEKAGETKQAKKPRRTDGPGEGDNTNRSNTRGTRGPWLKMTDAPADVQKEINRTAEKFAPKTKEGREGYVKRALESHYNIHKNKTGK